MRKKSKTVDDTSLGNAGIPFSIIIKGSLVAVSCSLLLILVFAFLLKFTNIPESIIVPINQVIKGISVFAGVFLGISNTRRKGLISGTIIGLTYSVIAFFVFSLLAGYFVFDLTLLVDLLFSGIIGGVCGIICVNLKKSSN